jgi:hypothetical protein
MINGTGIKKVPLIVVVAFAAVLGMQGVKSFRALAEKALAQEAVTESVMQWKQGYMAFADTVKKWDGSFRSEDSVQDLISLYSVVGLSSYGLRADSDTLLLNKVAPVAQGGIAIGLTQFCIASASRPEGALDVEAANYQALFAGLRRLSQRPDVSIGSISIKGDKTTPVASLGEFCVLLRKG